MIITGKDFYKKFSNKLFINLVNNKNGGYKIITEIE